MEELITPMMALIKALIIWKSQLIAPGVTMKNLFQSRFLNLSLKLLD